MRKLILPFLALSCFWSNECISGWGGQDRSSSGNYTCYEHDKDFYHCRAYSDTSWGKNSKCDGVAYKPARPRHNAYGTGHGAHRTIEGTRYICCRRGQYIGFVPHEKRETFTRKTIIEKESTTTGTDGSVRTCWLIKKYTVCAPYGDDANPGTPDREFRTCNTCKAPTTAYRNGECIEHCGQNDSTMAYASFSSNECIQCETNAHQGIIEDENGYNVCQKCNPETELFVDGVGCKAKNEFQMLNKLDMNKCWQTANPKSFECCITVGVPNDYKFTNLPETINEAKNKYECCIFDGDWDSTKCTEKETTTQG